MSMPEPAMKPQDTVIYLLGELKGEMTATRESVASASNAQQVVNAQHAREHEAFRDAIEQNTLDLAAVKAAQPLKVSGWNKAGVIIAVPASAVALVGFVILYLNPN